MSATPRTILIGVAGMVCVLALGYFLYAHRYVVSTSLPASPSLALAGDTPAPGFAAPSATSTPQPSAALQPRTPASLRGISVPLPAGMAEYRNTAYRFSLFYPSDLSVKTYAEGGGASTITFQNVAAAQGFQIFVVPYSAPQVSTARFKEDEPSGVMQNPLNITIGGATATSFYGSDVTLGSTAEIWFLHGGYLFEVTAPKSLAPWFSQIMQTWMFI